MVFKRPKMDEENRTPTPLPPKHSFPGGSPKRNKEIRNIESVIYRK
jgi:hypothetical protein